jgi:hypothetical protein
MEIIMEEKLCQIQYEEQFKEMEDAICLLFYNKIINKKQFKNNYKKLEIWCNENGIEYKPKKIY